MYGHPYTPYDAQIQFMTDLYGTLTHKKIGLFESPTGTGKTLSLLCPSLAWLRDSAMRKVEEDLQIIEKTGGPPWIVENAKKLRLQEFEHERSTHTQLINTARQLNSSNNPQLIRPTKRSRINSHNASDISSASLDDKAFLLEDESAPDLAEEGTKLLQMFEDAAAGEDDSTLVPLRTTTKIFFASRTHSQLSQVAHALASVKVPETPRFITLGSRRQLCIHPEVTKLASTSSMNEKCADLQKGAKCSFRNRSSLVKSQALGEIMDIEDLHKFGEQHGSCPYYAARETLPYAEVVALPYPLLLSARNREVLDVDLRNSVVIIDEAHNLIDSITALHSASLTVSAVASAARGLMVYSNKFSTRLAPSNRRKLHQVMKLVDALYCYFKSLNPKQIKPGAPVDKAALFALQNADTLNIAELSEFVQTSKLVFKVDSYIQAREAARGEKFESEASVNAKGEAPDDDALESGDTKRGTLGAVMDFVSIVADPISEGRLFHEVSADQAGQPRIKLCYLVLDASSKFKPIVDEARAVVLAGGTMEPVADFKNYLVPYVDPCDVSTNTYGHIVPASQLLVMPVSSFRFTFANRNDATVIAGLGELVLKISASTPHGVVAFFPGYKYLAQVLAHWSQTGVLAKLQAVKRVFSESSKSANIFDKYASFARRPSCQGAILLAVVGGKLSEGINFSDELARAVIMVGLPFPNAFSAEMVAKRSYIEQQAMRQRERTREQAQEEARQYYENLAMRAVNQSVGRAIRHMNDYAAIYLIDERYSSPHIQGKLSKWVRDSIYKGSSDKPDLEKVTRDFFVAQEEKKKLEQ